MTKRKAERAATVDAKTSPPKKKKLTMVLLEKQDQEITNHVNMTVQRVNCVIQHLNFLHKKLIEMTRLYNNEFGNLKQQINDLRFRQDQTYPCDPPSLPPFFDTLCNIDPIAYTPDPDLEMMSENDLIKSVKKYADNL